jgi:hypothetical protein
MPALTHFAPALSAGGLLIGNSSVNNQLNGLIEVSVDYLCRTTDLTAQLGKFFLDAAPPVFPTKTINPATLANGKLHMSSYSVNESRGIATINARYAGVRSGVPKPFLTFSYQAFSVKCSVFAALDGRFGGQQFIGGPEFDNDFSRNPGIATVTFGGEAQSISYNFATLNTDLSNSSSAAPQPPDESAIVKISVLNAQNLNGNGRFGDVLTEPEPREKFNSAQPAAPLANARDVAAYVLSANNYPFGFQLSDIPAEQWKERGVYPSIFWIVERKAQAITPSVYVREIVYRPVLRR